MNYIERLAEALAEDADELELFRECKTSKELDAKDPCYTTWMSHAKEVLEKSGLLSELKQRVHVMGQGQILISSGVYGGCPSVIIANVEDVGEIGKPAPEMEDYVRENGTIIQFTTAESMENFIKKMLDSCEMLAEQNGLTFK